MINAIIYITLYSLSLITISESQQKMYTASCYAPDTNTGSIINAKSNTNYEVVAGTTFVYLCEFFVDTTVCAHNPIHLDCAEHDIKWELPETLRNIVQENGVSRVNTTVNKLKKDGYDLYHSFLNISHIGRIHDGLYNWKQILKYQDRTVNEGSFNIKVIDFIEISQACTYADSCASNYCVKGVCEASASTGVSWLLVGLILGGVIIMIVVVVAAVVTIVIRKKNSNNRRHG